SADGHWLAYLRQESGQVAVHVRDRRSGADTLAVAAGVLSGPYPPGLSPDAGSVVLGAAGGPGLEPDPARCPGQQPQATLLGGSTALAHGLPEELWRVGPDGSGLTRLTNLCLD